MNTLSKMYVEFHILQSFPVTCLNRDDVGAPKSAVVGGTPRARVSSQCWKRQVRLTLHEMGVRTGIRTKRLAQLIAENCRERGAGDEAAGQCGAILGEMLAKDTLFFITPAEVAVLGEYAAKHEFVLPVESAAAKKGKGKAKEEELVADEDAGKDAGKSKIPSLPKTEVSEITKKLKACKTAADGLDIALFGRMAAQAPELNIQAAASFSHAISTHRVSNEVEFFTALDDMKQGPGAEHMGSLEFNSATYYRYVSLNLGQLWDSLGGEDVGVAVEAFVKALYMAVPAARQATQSGACPWDYARVLVRRGQRIQAPFDKAVCAKDGYVSPSKEALNDFLQRQEQLSGSLFGKLEDFTFGEDMSFNIDKLAAALASFAAAPGGKA